MRNPELASDYVRRAAVRLRALDVLYDGASWADVVREAQEIVELALKGLLRAFDVEPPRIHDVSDVLLAERARFPRSIATKLHALAESSRQLRRDCELAFYGAEDLTPSGFYSQDDANRARASARQAVALIAPVVPGVGE
jgi:HEPN domain-containing protein